MAATVAIKAMTKAGVVRLNLVEITLDTSYDTGGETVLPNQVGLSEILVFHPAASNGYTFEYDYVNKKLKAFSGAGTEVTSGTDLSSIVVRAAVYGY